MVFRLFSISDDLWGIKFKSLILRQKIPRTMFSVFFYPSRRFGISSRFACISSPKVYLICRMLSIFSLNHIRNRMIQSRCHSQEIRDHRAYTTNRFGSSPKRRGVNGFLIITHKSDDFLQPPLSFMLCQIPFLPIRSDHTYIVKNFGSSESRFAADA